MASPLGGGVGHEVGAARLQVDAGREFVGLAERRGAVIEIQQAAPPDFGEDGSEGGGVGGQFRPEVVDDPYVTLKPRP